MRSRVFNRSSDKVRDVFDFILPRYYRGRMRSIRGVVSNGRRRQRESRGIQFPTQRS
jgi:hypothetical protein